MKSQSDECSIDSKLSISDQDLELLKAIKTKSAMLNLSPNTYNLELMSPKKKSMFAVNKLFEGLSKTVSFNQRQEFDNPVYEEKKNIFRGSSLIIREENIQAKKLPQECEGLPEILIDEKKKAAKNILSLLEIREKYRFKKHQNYNKCSELIIHLPGSTEPIINYAKEITPIEKLEGATLIQNSEGVYEVLINEKNIGEKIPTSVEFFEDLSILVDHIYKSMNKSLAHKRIHILDEKFKMHSLYYSEKEHFETQQTSHRDFYNCRKVDTHIHFAACMRAKQLLRFMVDKIEKDGDRKVILSKSENKWISLKEICNRIGVNSKDINLDSLNVQVNYLYIDDNHLIL